MGGHAKVVEGIKYLLENDNSSSIALLGEFGSGKSSIISALKDDLSQSQDRKFAFLVYDAWVHRGESVRRAFIQELQDVLDEQHVSGGRKPWGDPAQRDEKIRKLLYQVTKETRTSAIRPTFTVVLAFVLIPILTSSAPLLENVKEFLTQGYGGLLWAAFALALFFDFAKASASDQKWSLLAQSSTTLQGERTADPSDPSTTEFNRVFEEVVSAALSSSGAERHPGFFDVSLNWSKLHSDLRPITARSSIEKLEKLSRLSKSANDQRVDHRHLVIVIENLDRLSTEEITELWSTLQTFLYLRSHEPSPGSSGHTGSEGKKWQDRVWLIVPMSPEAVEEVSFVGDPSTDPVAQNGSSEDSGSESGDEKTMAAIPQIQSFVDKTFQLTVNVPDLVFTETRKYFRDRFTEGFKKGVEERFEQQEDAVYRTFQLLRPEPSPRRVIRFLNDLIGLQTQCETCKPKEEKHDNAPEEWVVLLAGYIMLRRNLLTDLNGTGRGLEQELRTILKQRDSGARPYVRSFFDRIAKSQDDVVWKTWTAIHFRVPFGKALFTLYYRQISGYLTPVSSTGIQDLVEDVKGGNGEASRVEELDTVVAEVWSADVRSLRSSPNYFGAVHRLGQFDCDLGSEPPNLPKTWNKIFDEVENAFIHWTGTGLMQRESMDWIAKMAHKRGPERGPNAKSLTRKVFNEVAGEHSNLILAGRNLDDEGMHRAYVRTFLHSARLAQVWDEHAQDEQLSPPRVSTIPASITKEGDIEHLEVAVDTACSDGASRKSSDRDQPPPFGKEDLRGKGSGDELSPLSLWSMVRELGSKAGESQQASPLAAFFPNGAVSEKAYRGLLDIYSAGSLKRESTPGVRSHPLRRRWLLVASIMATNSDNLVIDGGDSSVTSKLISDAVDAIMEMGRFRLEVDTFHLAILLAFRCAPEESSRRENAQVGIEEIDIFRVEGQSPSRDWYNEAAEWVDAYSGSPDAYPLNSVNAFLADYISWCEDDAATTPNENDE